VQFAVGFKIQGKTAQVVVDAEDPLIAALKVEMQRPEALIPQSPPGSFLLSAGPVRHLVTTLVFAENLVLLDIRPACGWLFLETSQAVSLLGVLPRGDEVAPLATVAAAEPLT
jgi:hypothetical protein